MFRRSPVIRLSIPMTWCPSAKKRSQRWDPKKPAAPVMRVFFMYPCTSFYLVLSIGLGLSPHRIEYGLYHDLEIQEQGPVLDIEDIEFDTVINIVLGFDFPTITPHL